MTFLQEEVPIEKSPDNTKILIKFILHDGDNWVEMESIDPSDPSLVKCVVEKHTSERQFLFNTTLWSIAPSECLEAVVADGTNVILLIPEGNINIDCELLISALKLGSNAGDMGKSTLKRAVIDDISEQDHI